jgi:hypothetical protein
MIRRIAFPFPRLTFLDLIGGYDALRRVASMGIDGARMEYRAYSPLWTAAVER